MRRNKDNIKQIIPADGWFVAYSHEEPTEHGLHYHCEPLACWALIDFVDDANTPNEYRGQQIVGMTPEYHRLTNCSNTTNFLTYTTNCSDPKLEKEALEEINANQEEGEEEREKTLQ